MRRTRICLEGWCYLILVAFVVGGAMIREINLLLIVAGAMLGPLVLGWRLLVRMLAKVTVERFLPHGVGAGELFSVKLVVKNQHRRLGVWGLAVENEIQKLDAPRRLVETSSTAFFPFVRQGEQSRQSYDCRIHDRGAYTFGRLRVSSRFPMGLIKRTLVMGAPTTLYVYPRLGRLRRKWLETVHPSHLGNQRSQHRPGLTEGEFHSLRDWRNSDSRRWIHWRTTARRNQLTVRQFERRQNRNLALLLELRSDRPTCEEIERLIRFAATVVASHCRTGSSQLLLGIAGRKVEILTGVSSAGLMRDCMELLATAAVSDEDRLPTLVDQALGQIDHQSRVVIVSTHHVDLLDTTRFANVWDQPGKRQRFSRVKCLEATDDNLAALFEETAPQRTPMDPGWAQRAAERGAQETIAEPSASASPDGEYGGATGDR